MDENDKEILYAATEMTEYSPNGDFPDKFIEDKSKQSTSSSGSCRIVVPLMLALIAILLILILILQSVTLYDVRINPSVCSPSTATTGESSASTGRDDSTTCNCSASTTCTTNADNTEANAELLRQINLLLNATSRVLSFSELQAMYIENSTDYLEQNYEDSQESALRLTDIIATLSYLKDNSITTEGIVNDILWISEELLKSQNATLLSLLQATSCQDIRNRQPNSPSGYYHIHSQIVYCEMGELCSTDGGWTRLGFLDMSDSTQDCPEGFRLYEVGSVRACGRPVGGPSCSSVKLPSNGISYSEVCGRVIGYQYASTDAVDTRFAPPSIRNDINSYYADCISITQGYPREHLWTYMAGVSENWYDHGNCPCNTPPGATQEIRPFMGDHYYCESGNPAGWTYKLYADDPLWDGEGCGSQEGNCCAVEGQPWFHRTLNSSTDYLEVRVCADETTVYDDLPVNLYEIYVK